MLNFFNTIRGKEKLNAPIDDASVSMAMVHYANMAYRVNKGFSIDEKTRRIYDRDAMQLWGLSLAFAKPLPLFLKWPLQQRAFLRPRWQGV